VDTEYGMTAKHKRYYFWLKCKDLSGKVYLVFGSDLSMDDARTHGLELLGNTDFEIRRLPTRNLSRASQMTKGTRLEETHDITKASEKLGHEKSLRRQLKKHKKLPPWLEGD
jgi:hypothetical protein